VKRFARRLTPLVLIASLAVAVACGTSPDSSDPVSLELDLQKETGAPWIVERHPTLKTPTFLEPKDDSKIYLAPGGDPEAAARKFLERFKEGLGLADPARDLEREDSETGAGGLTYVSFLQKAEGIPVLGTRISVVFEPQGSVAFVSAQIVPNADRAGHAPALTAQDAEARALAANNAVAADLRDTTSPELAVYASDDKDARLVWLVDVRFEANWSRDVRIAVDATTGAIVSAEGRSHRATATAKNLFAYLPAASGRRDEAATSTFDTVVEGTTTVMGRGPRTGTHDEPSMRALNAAGNSITVGTGGACDDAAALRRTGVPSYTITPKPSGDVNKCIDADYASITVTADGRGVAPITMANLVKVEKFYRDTWRRKGPANNGARIDVRFHKADEDGNASWNGASGRTPGFFSIGDMPSATGREISYGALLDVLGHEYQHAITESTLNLTYLNESGALDESISDIFGAFTQRATEPEASEGDLLKLGEGLRGPGRKPDRDFADPMSVAEYPQPYHMAVYKRCAPNANNDNGGVHINSGIPNFAFKLIVAGGSNCPPSSTAECAAKKIAPLTIEPGSALGWDRAQTLYWALLSYKGIPRNGSFQDAARALVATAERVFPDARRNPAGPMRTVACAFVGTGVITDVEAKRNWNIKCSEEPGDAGIEAGTGNNCVNDDTQACSGRRVCSWHGDGYCCKNPIPINCDGGACVPAICYSDADCAAGEVCGRTTNDATAAASFACVKRGTMDCFPRPPQPATDASTEAGDASSGGAAP
jgi:bacillolysin